MAIDPNQITTDLTLELDEDVISVEDFYEGSGELFLGSCAKFPSKLLQVGILTPGW